MNPPYQDGGHIISEVYITPKAGMSSHTFHFKGRQPGSKIMYRF